MFILFAGLEYYPAGGARDYINVFNTRKEAIEAGKKIFELDKYSNEGRDWGHVLDINGRVVIQLWGDICGCFFEEQFPLNVEYLEWDGPCQYV